MSVYYNITVSKPKTDDTSYILYIYIYIIYYI